MKEINRYRLALIQYYLSYIFPKILFKTDSGFCYHFSRSYNIITLEPIHVLDTLEPIDKYSPGFWFKKGELKPRIELLKQAIKLCKKN